VHRIPILAILSLLATPAVAQLSVVAIDPPLNATHRAPNTAIVIDFDRALLATSLGSASVYGSTSGPIAGALLLENGDTRLRFQPERAYLANESVTMTLDENLQALDGTLLRTQGYVASFRVKTAPATRQFVLNSSWSVSPGVFARIYGGQSCDLNDDDFPDLAVVCEVSSDVRVYLSNHDASGSFGALHGAPYPTGDTPSPNENADMNGDGFIDILTCDTIGGTVSVLMGNGDGSFQAPASYPMGTSYTRGLAVLDANGDGHTDVVMTGNGQLNLRLNNGDGSLGAASAIGTAVSGDYGLCSADMNNDGIVDLVVGGSTSAMVLLSNGDGTFTPKPTQNSGFCWMIVCGDVNNDGNMDVSVANGGNGRGSILRGNGDGTLQAPFQTPVVGTTTATDLGDLDGDGDLDWVLSSFGGGVFQVWRNDGSGSFALDQTLPSPSNPACCQMMDIDGDRDLDLVLFDEIADIVTILENGVLDAPTFCYGTSTACPCGNLGANGHGCENSHGTGGGLLLAQGRASTGSDSLSLNVSGLPPVTNMVFFQGTAASGGGAGTPFYDGLLCAGGTIKRLAARSALHGFASFGAGNAGDPLLSSVGGIPGAGGVFYYQVWYRDNAAFCTSGTSNTSNGVAVTWTP